MICVICGKPILPGETYMAPPPVDAPWHSPKCYRATSVRYKRDGKWITTEPGEPLYSAALFAAEECLTENGWEPIGGVE